MKYEIIIIRNSDGVRATHVYEGEWEEVQEFIWTEGNFSCDCNRAILFAAARNEEEPQIICSDGKYSVIIPPRPHDESCPVFKYADTLVGVDRRGVCTCGAEADNARRATGI